MLRTYVRGGIHDKAAASLSLSSVRDRAEPMRAEKRLYAQHTQYHITYEMRTVDNRGV